MIVVHNLRVTAMLAISVFPFLAVALAGLLYLRLTLQLMAAYRACLRPQAERLAIEKRWLERWSRSRRDFARRWHAELRTLYAAQVPRSHRFAFGIGAFERALDAELAGLLNREIASWTFADRAGGSQEGYERLVAAGLERFGWTVGAPAGEARRILTRGGHRLAVLFHFDGTDAACRSVEALARWANRTGCEAACILTNGRTRGAARAFADAFGVALLHCSQLDGLDGLLRMSAPQEERRLAA